MGIIHIFCFNHLLNLCVSRVIDGKDKLTAHLKEFKEKLTSFITTMRQSYSGKRKCEACEVTARRDRPSTLA